jgi:epoxyqueuosine reductase QueG
MAGEKDILEYLRGNGADLTGIADLAPFREEGASLPLDLVVSYVRAVSVGVALDGNVIEGITERPTPGYAQHYREVNARLDALALRAVDWLREKGFRAEAVPASKILDEGKLLGGISRKAVARMAGLGWQGKSLLIINPEFGPRIRLVTVLTDMPLEPGTPLKNGCGRCSACADACPAGAIKNTPTEGRYQSREEAVDLGACHSRTLENRDMPGIGARVCGVCIRACPVGG